MAMVKLAHGYTDGAFGDIIYSASISLEKYIIQTSIDWTQYISESGHREATTKTIAIYSAHLSGTKLHVSSTQ